MEYGEDNSKKGRKHRRLLALLQRRLNSRAVKGQGLDGDYELIDYITKKRDRLVKQNPNIEKDFEKGDFDDLPIEYFDMARPKEKNK